MTLATGPGATQDAKQEGRLRYRDQSGASSNLTQLNEVLDNPDLSSRIDLAGGIIYTSGPLLTRVVRGGPHIRGAGGPHNELTETDYGLQISNPAVSRIGTATEFIFLGTADSTYDVSSMIRVRSMGATLEDLTFTGRRITGNATYAGTRCNYGVTFEDTLAGGVNTSKATIRNCVFLQCVNAIYIPPIFQQDTILLDGILAEQGCDTFVRCDESQSLGVQMSGILTCSNDTPDFICFDYSRRPLDTIPGGNANSGGAVNCTGQIFFNRSGTLLKTGYQSYSTGMFNFTFVKWDAGHTPNYTWPRVVVMGASAEVHVRACVSFSNETADNYRRPIVYPKGTQYDIRLDDMMQKLHQVDQDAWPTSGVISSTDDCMDYTPATPPDYWWHFGDPAHYDSAPSDGGTVQTIRDKIADANDLVQGTAGSRMTYDVDGFHHRPCLTGDGDYYAAATTVGPNEAEIYVSVVAAPTTNGANVIALASCAEGSANVVWILQVLANNTVNFIASNSGNLTADFVQVTSSNALEADQQSLIEAWFDGGAAGTGRIGVRVNGVTTVDDHSLATLYNSVSAVTRVGAVNFAGSVVRTFVGRIYGVMIDTTIPSTAELNLRRDAMCSQTGCPVDVYVPMDIKGATNATPIIVTTGVGADDYQHGLTDDRFVVIEGVKINAIAAAAYDHTGNGEGERHISLTAGFTNYTFVTGDQLVVTAATGGVAVGTYTIASKVDADAILLSADGGLTADATGITASILSARINTTHKLDYISTATFGLRDINGNNVVGHGVYSSGGTVTQI